MTPDYPLLFEPILQERLWGGAKLQELFGRPVPEKTRIGESWEISDRPGAESCVRNGPLQGRTLRQLMTSHGEAILGRAPAEGERFPWLGKLLDARDTLSLQVHPPARIAATLGGEPKTELWYVAHAEVGACFYAGLKPGIDREAFVRALEEGTVADCFHPLPVARGDVLFLPSGRVHALGKGLVIFEIQQNSDTTYRVFDWDRRDKHGQLRALHVQEALASIDFHDHAPALVPRVFHSVDGAQVRSLVRDPLFEIDEIRWTTDGMASDRRPRGSMGLLIVLSGCLELRCGDKPRMTRVDAGSFCLLPACLNPVEIWGDRHTAFLQVIQPSTATPRPAPSP